MPCSDSQSSSAHIARCLRLNPLWQSEEILESRTTVLGLKPEQGASFLEAQSQASEKYELRDQLKTLRKNVWKSPLPKLRSQLQALALDNHPDLQQLAIRLNTIIEVRPRLPGMIEHKDFDADFFDCFKKVISGTPREGAEIRERVFTSFRKHKLRKRGLRMIKLLRREVPELCAFEEPWLDSLKRRKPQSRLIGQSREARSGFSTGGYFSGSWRWWLLAFVILRILARILRHVDNG